MTAPAPPSPDRTGAACAPAAHASRLLASLGVHATVQDDGLDPLAVWARSGAMALTGRPDGPPLVHTGPAVSVTAALLALRALAPSTTLPDARLLGERAALSGLRRGGAVSCGGATRLLPCADGWVALTLSRPCDLDLVPALVEAAVDDPWEAVGRWLQRTSRGAAVARGRLLGLPLTALGEVEAALPWRVVPVRPGSARRSRVRVVDLSGLWAGPLASSLLRRLGAEVLVVEDPRRPDGTRTGCPALHALLHRDVEHVPLDLRTEGGRDRLHALLRSADVVLEASRPRALAQMGLPAERLLAEADLTWVSITAHGRASGDRGGYGDDAAVAGGLVVHDPGGPLFVGDAVADPLTGVHAALAGWAGALAGGARLVDVALSRVAATAAGLAGPPVPAVRRGGRWHVPCEGGLVEVRPPRARALPETP